MEKKEELGDLQKNTSIIENIKYEISQEIGLNTEQQKIAKQANKEKGLK